MSTDIYVSCEIRRNGKWELQANDAIYIHESNMLFAVFAGVRNYYEITPISSPRGLPDNVSADIAKEFNRSAYWHSASWLTLREIKDFNWDEEIQREGIVDKKRFKQWLADGIPANAAQAIFSSNCYIATNQEMREKLDARHDFPVYTVVRWKETIKSCVGARFFQETIPAIEKLGEPEDVRLVFWFGG